MTTGNRGIAMDDHGILWQLSRIATNVRGIAMA